MPKRTIEVRTRISVEIGSPEEMLWEFLKNKKATPYRFHQMLTMAVTPFWLALAYQYNKYPKDLVVQALEDGAYSWQVHDNYLHQKTRIPRVQLARDEPVNKPRQLPPELPKSMDETNSDSTLAISSAKSRLVENETSVLKKDTTEPFNLFGQGIISKQSK